MGNQTQKKQQTQNKIILQLRQRSIILHHAYHMKLEISDVGIFPHGLDGLKLWESDIIGARYAIIQNQRFKNKQILILKAGVGLVGITMKKWTKCLTVYMAQFHQQVITNIKRNCNKNQCKDVVIYRFDWKQYKSYSHKYDIIFATDLLYTGCPYGEIYSIFKLFLEVNGVAILIVPDRNNDADKFLNLIQQEYFEVSKKKLINQQYQMSPLFNKIEGLNQFPFLGKIDFFVYHIKKKYIPVKQEIIKIQKQKIQQNIVSKIQAKIQSNVSQKVQKQDIQQQIKRKNSGDKDIEDSISSKSGKKSNIQDNINNNQESINQQESNNINQQELKKQIQQVKQSPLNSNIKDNITPLNQDDAKLVKKQNIQQNSNIKEIQQSQGQKPNNNKKQQQNHHSQINTLKQIKQEPNNIKTQQKQIQKIQKIQENNDKQKQEIKNIDKNNNEITNNQQQKIQQKLQNISINNQKENIQNQNIQQNQNNKDIKDNNQQDKPKIQCQSISQEKKETENSTQNNNQSKIQENDETVVTGDIEPDQDQLKPQQKDNKQLPTKKNKKNRKKNR